MSEAQSEARAETASEPEPEIQTGSQAETQVKTPAEGGTQTVTPAETALQAKTVIQAEVEPATDLETQTEQALQAGVTFLREFIRVPRTRPDWLYGMVCSWLLGLGTLAFLAIFTKPDWSAPMSTVVVPVVLTAIADGSLTNQLAAEPEWTAGQLRAGTDPGRLLFVRNVFLAFWELVFVALVVYLVARTGHHTAWIVPALPQLAVLPLASIAIGNLASVLVPCPFARMGTRLQAVGTWARWSIYVAIPFALSSIAGAMWALPTLLEHRWEAPLLAHAERLKHHTPTAAHVTAVYVTIWLVVIPIWHLTVWFFSLRLSSGLARARRKGLIRLMDKHEQLASDLPELSLVAAARQLPARVKEIPSDLRAELKLIGSEFLDATTTLSRL